MLLPFDALEKIAWSVLVSIGFAVLFKTPRRALWVVGLLGGIGFGIKVILLHSIMPEQVIFASLAGASAVGVLGIYFAHRVHTPPIVFTIPAVINMIPGIYGYEFIIGLIQIVSHGKENQFNFTYVMEIFSYGLKAGFIMLALAFGIIVPLLISNAKTTKDTPDVHRVIRDQVIPKVKIIRRSRRRK